ncbi:MAG: chromosomal replication initiator protein DnaA [bacterium]|nr:chromosomal replication initiator protein DnaA [bacterium]
MTKEELWKAVLGEMETSLSKANFTTWFKNTSIVASETDSIVVSVPNGFIKEWLENKFNKQILTSIQHLVPEIREVRYTIGNNNPFLNAKKDFSQFVPDKLADQKQSGEVNPQTNLNKKYSFDSFVVGSHNELAHAATLAVSKGPGKVYNPLFLYGGVGLGKTHLLQSTGNKVLEDDPTKKILYIPSERLTQEIVESVRNKSVEDLKHRYAKIDVLIIDDIQFIAGKEKTQEIIFSTFNELYGKNKQIILSSDRPPKAIPALEERLRSRFEGGMIADVSLPDYETRLAILKMKSKQKNFELDENVYSYIATNIQKNIRELEGALNRVIAVSQIYNKSLDLKEVKKLLVTYLSTPYKKTTPQLILKSVSDFYGISLQDLVKRSRKKEVVRPRQIAMYLLREETKSSFPEIGQKLGGRDHSTVIHAYEKVKTEEESDEATKQELVLIKERIYQSMDK